MSAAAFCSPLLVPPRRHRTSSPFATAAACSAAPVAMALAPRPQRKVFFVLGNAGSGKGTQCALLVDAFHLAHVSAGDLLRTEVASGSGRGREIGRIIEDGRIVPGDVTLDLLRRAIDKTDAAGVLVDGFPRNLDQAAGFTDSVSDFEFALYFDCPEDELMQRLVTRGETSGRSDDNEVAIRKRFRTFRDTCRPVIDLYAAQGRIVHVDCLRSVEEIFDDIRPLFEAALNAKANVAVEDAT